MRIERGQVRGVGDCLTEMDRGLLDGACLEWGLSGWAGQPYGNMGERQAGALNSAEEKDEEREGYGGCVSEHDSTLKIKRRHRSGKCRVV